VIVSINQPAYLPWMGHFDRIRESDVHVVLDDVQFAKNDLQNRNRVRAGGKDGWQWLTVPVLTKGKFGAALNEVEVDNSRRWGRKQLKTLKQEYGKEPGFDVDWWDNVLTAGWQKLIGIVEMTSAWTREQLEIDTPLVRSSNMGVPGAGSDRVLRLCQKLDADVYLAGPMSRDYLDTKAFKAAGIEVRYHDWKPPADAMAAPGTSAAALATVDQVFRGTA
jgi:hypothetical protein